jgi:predicted dithiol-disulfide oxidoreductase (DUF899 family)
VGTAPRPTCGCRSCSRPAWTRWCATASCSRATLATSGRATAAGQTSFLKLEEGPCPSSVALLDQLDGAVEHASQHINLAVVAKAPLPRVVTFAEERGWRRLRLLSSAGNTYNRDYLAETPEGSQRPMLNVFHRDGGVIRHFWGSELFYAPTEAEQDPRHVGTIEPVWNLFDLTPEGRGTDWDEQLRYA